MIKADFSVKPTEQEMLKILGKSSGRILGAEQNRRAFEEAGKELIELVKPVALWNKFPVRQFTHDRVVLENGVKIGGGPVVTVVCGAEELILAICSIGSDVETKAKKYMKNGDVMKGIFLDTMASWAVDMVRKRFCEWAKEYFLSEFKLKSSVMLSPGESEWDVKEQAVIFKLLEEEAAPAGISISKSGVLFPVKSISLLIGLGSDRLGVEEGSNCDFCSLRARCRYRHMRP